VFQEHTKLLASASNLNADLPVLQEEEEIIWDHYDADDADFGEYDCDAAVF
jgi:hypothetical protein